MTPNRAYIVQHWGEARMCSVACAKSWMPLQKTESRGSTLFPITWLYARRGSAICLPSVKHYRQLSFDLQAIWFAV